MRSSNLNSINTIYIMLAFSRAHLLALTIFCLELKILLHRKAFWIGSWLDRGEGGGGGGEIGLNRKKTKDTLDCSGTHSIKSFSHASRF